MKKIFIVLSVIALLAISNGCSSNDGFEIVKRVTFTSGGEVRTLYSEWYIITSEAQGNWKVATESEFNNAPDRFKFGPYMATSQYDIYGNIFTGTIDTLPKGDNLYYPRQLSGDDIGESFFIKISDFGGYSIKYYTTKFERIGNSLLEIKIKDDDHITIRRGVNTYNYTVTSLSIVHY